MRLSLPQFLPHARKHPGGAREVVSGGGGALRRLGDAEGLGLILRVELPPADPPVLFVREGLLAGDIPYADESAWSYRQLYVAGAELPNDASLHREPRAREGTRSTADLHADHGLPLGKSVDSRGQATGAATSSSSYATTRASSASGASAGDT